MRHSQNIAKVASIRKGLLEYCKLDILAMRRILEKMKDFLN